MLKKIASISILLNLFVIGYSQLDFTRVTKTIGSDLEVVDIGDINNDGLNDVVVGAGYYFDVVNDYHLFIYYQNSDSTLNTPVKIKYPDSYPGLHVLHISDVNNDSLNDVIIGYSDSIGIYYQNPRGGLEPVKTYYSGYDVDGLKTGDLNNDGLTDIAVCHWNDAFIKVFYQTPDGTLNAVSYPIDNAGYDEIDVSDVNNDGLDDIIRMPGQLNTGALHVFYQDPISGITGAFQTFNYSFDYRKTFNGIGTGDLNGDNKNDIVGAIGGNTAAIVLLVQDSANNVFSNPVQLKAYDIPTPVEIYDMNCDKSNEIVVGHHGWGSVTIYEKNATNSFKDYVKFRASYYYNPYSMAIGDINNDNKPDIVTVGHADVEFLYNSSIPTRFTDIDTSLLNLNITIDTIQDYHNYQVTVVDSGSDCHVRNIYLYELYTKTKYERHTGDSAFFRSGEICSNDYADTVLNHFDYTIETTFSADTNVILLSADTIIYNPHFTGSYYRADTLDMWTELETETLRLEDIAISNDTVIIKVDSVKVTNRILYVNMDYFYYTIYEGIRCKKQFIDTLLNYRNQGTSQRLIYTDTLILSQTVERYPSVTTSLSDYPERDFVLYPNPVHDRLTVEFAKPGVDYADLRILNLSGKVEFRERINNAGKYTVNLSGLSAGYYVIEIRTDTKRFMGKILKN